MVQVKRADLQALLASLKTLADAVEIDVKLFHGQPHKESALGIARTVLAKFEDKP